MKLYTEGQPEGPVRGRSIRLTSPPYPSGSGSWLPVVTIHGIEAELASIIGNQLDQIQGS